MRLTCALVIFLLARPVFAAGTLEDIMAGSERAAALVGLQVVTLRDGQIDQSVALGHANLERGTALTPAHKMRVASISKLVTAIAAMQLVESGQMSLDEDVTYLLGWRLRNPNFPDSAITLRQLLSHTSSIRDGDYYWLNSGEKLQDFFLEGSAHYNGGAHFAAKKGQKPGRYFTYSNLNFGIIAAIIETQSGDRFDRYVRRNILQPLGIDASFSACDIPAKQLATLYRGTEAQVDGDMLYCHYGADGLKRGEPAPMARLTGYWPGENPTLFSPQGGLRASAEDLARLMMMFLNGGSADGRQILKPETVQRMIEPVWGYSHVLENGHTGGEEAGLDGLMTSYGLSVHITDLKDWGLTKSSKRVYGHLGEAYGLLGGFWFDPVAKDGFIALITGTQTPPKVLTGGLSPLTYPETKLMRWWLGPKHLQAD